jgi:hypothetical protein
LEQLDYSLVLLPHSRPAMIVPLFADVGEPLTIDDVSESTNAIFSDLTYTAQVIGLEADSIDQIQFYVNGDPVDCVIRSGNIYFPIKNGMGQQRIFLDCYGFVDISIVISLKTGEEIHLHTGYIAVLVHKGALNDSVRAMVEYVYTHQEELLLNGEARAKDYADLRDGGRKSLESQIMLANEIASVYESSYGYFKANCRFKMCSHEMVDQFEKLQQVTPGTLQYITQHPEQLRQVIGIAGVRVRNCTYQPNKTLVTQNIYSTDIYENQVIVSFLKQMVLSTKELNSKIDQIIDNFPADSESKDEYIYSSYFIFAHTKKILEEDKRVITKLTDRFQQLWTIYQHTLQTTGVILNCPPKPTAVFLSVPQYNRIFVRIHQWFTFGIYNFSQEKFMLSLIKISLLYETYLLTKFIQYFKGQGLKLTEAKPCHYPTHERWKYQNTQCNNTFIFSDSQQIITLYYQPVIFDSDKSSVNQIGLYRNNTISFGTDEDVERKGHYYVPDFLIKISRECTSKYILCDAKFSTTGNALSRYFPNLAYKYLFSVSPVAENDVISGLCVINGRELSGCRITTAYDKQLEGQHITPFAEVLSLAEGIENEKHFENIRKLLQLI